MVQWVCIDALVIYDTQDFFELVGRCSLHVDETAAYKINHINFCTQMGFTIN